MYQICFILEWHSTCFGRSFRPSPGVKDCTYSNRHLSKRCCCLLASGYPQYLFDKRLLLYVESWIPDDGRKDRPKHVECHSKIKWIWYIGESSWFYYRNNVTLHGPMDVKLGNIFQPPNTLNTRVPDPKENSLTSTGISLAFFPNKYSR